MTNFEHHLKPTHSGKVPSGVELYYESFGKDSDPAIILIMGLGMQAIAWHEDFIEHFVNEGYRVIRFDNRDIGLSASANSGIRFDMRKDFLKQKLGFKIDSNYLLYELAADVIGLMDSLNIEKAHLAGMSMGGMIGQITTALYPNRVLSLTSIMSNTNAPDLPAAKFPVLLRMSGVGVKRSRKKEIVVPETVKTFQLLRGSKHGISDQELIEYTSRAFDRSFRPAGFLRQANAIMATGSFEHVLNRIQAPVLVMHGNEDPLVRVEGGKRSAQLIKDAKLDIIDGMGHDVPPSLFEYIAEQIITNAQQA